MSVQLEYGLEPVPGFQGMLAEPFSLSQIDTGLVRLDGGLGLGITVKPGAVAGQFIPCVATDEVFGVSVFSHHIEKDASGDVIYPDLVAFPRITKGRYWAIAGTALVIGDQVGQRISDGQLMAADGTTTLAFATVKYTAAAQGDLVVVEVNF